MSTGGMLDHLRTQRELEKRKLDKVLEGPEQEDRDLTSAEAQEFNGIRKRLQIMDGRIAELEDDERRQGTVAALRAEFGQTGHRSSSTYVIGGETYRRGDPARSWVRDLVAANLHGDPDAAGRLRANNHEVSIETRALSTTDGAGGDFVPPIWLVKQYAEFARAARVVANQIQLQALPLGTDTINLPRLTGGTATAEQATQNTLVQDTDATTDVVTASVATIAGQQVVSLQLIEQSPINMDDVLLADLMADLMQKIDIFVISNNAANKRGILNVAGINAITYTDASPTVPELYPKFADALNQVQTGRFFPADKWFMHPRRWNWMLSASDASARPLVLPEANRPQNALAFSTGTVDAQGLVGTLMGLPVYVDSNIPTTLGAGTNEDRIIGLRSEDVILYEGTPRAEAFREPFADKMSVLLRVYNYIALQSGRYPKAISVVSGSGLASPAF